MSLTGGSGVTQSETSFLERAVPSRLRSTWRCGRSNGESGEPGYRVHQDPTDKRQRFPPPFLAPDRPLLDLNRNGTILPFLAAASPAQRESNRSARRPTGAGFAASIHNSRSGRGAGRCRDQYSRESGHHSRDPRSARNAAVISRRGQLRS